MAKLDSLSSINNDALSFFGVQLVAERDKLDYSNEALANRIGDHAIISSYVSAELDSDGMVIDIKPVGIWRQATGLTGVAYGTSVFSILLGSILSFMLLTDWMANHKFSTVPLVGTATLIAINVVLWWLAIRAGARHARIATVDDAIAIVNQGIFFRSQFAWKASELKRVVHAFAGYSVNHVPRTELWIETTSGERFRCLRQLSRKELDGISRLLTEWLGRGTLEYDLPHQDPNLKFAVLHSMKVVGKR